MRHIYRRAVLFGMLPVVVLLMLPSADARVTRVVVKATQVEAPAAGAAPDAGALPYERISGLIYGEIDPRDRRNAIIQDIELAPKNARGMIEYVATFTLLKPAESAKNSGVLQYEVVNRGASLLPKDYASGDAFLMSGWQGDLPFGGKSIYGLPGETIQVPVVHNPDGSSITGPVLARFSNMAPGLHTLPIRTAFSYATSGMPPLPADTDTSHAELLSRSYEGVDGVSSTATVIAASDWSWGDCTGAPFPGTPDLTSICLRNSFDPALMYQLTYRGKDPLVLGVGLAAIRDVVSFFRNTQKDDAGWLNPLFGQTRATVGVGVSQAGNLLRAFLHLGFNEDELGHRVFDGAMPIVAVRQTPINHRFAVPGGASSLYEIGSDGVVWWAHWPDKVRGHAAAGLLDRCEATHTCPRIVEVLSSSEFWALRASPDFVGTDSSQDIPLPANVRRYYVASTQHGGGKGGFHAGPAAPPPQTPHTTTQNPIAGMACVLPVNPNPMIEIISALYADLNEWILDGKQPPPSIYPTLASGTLTPATSYAMGFPSIPGVPMPDGVANPLLVYELGTEFQANDLTGFLTKQPPEIHGVIAPLVPAVDHDGNEVGGIHTVQQQAALGTYLGWNITASGFSKGQYCSLTGSYIPFAVTRAERLAASDPRLSIEERYGTQEGFVCAVREAARRLEAQRLLLHKDAERIVREATTAEVLPADSASSQQDREIAQQRCSR